jgi:hypothetical protein
MNNKMMFAILLGILLTVGSVSAISFTTENVLRMLVETHVSLGNFTGNSTNPNPLENHYFIHNFLIPPAEETQRFKLTFDADCISGGANVSENYLLDVRCADGSYNQIDLSDCDCENLAYEDMPNLWVTVENATGYQFYGNIQYNYFWCIYSRNVTNTARIPTEFKVIIDSVGLSTQSEDLNTVAQKSAITSVSEAISEVVSINFQVWRIMFNIFEIVVLLVAFIGIPVLLIKLISWGINTVKKVGKS